MSKQDKINKLKEYIKNLVVQELKKDDELDEVSTTATAGIDGTGTGHYDTPRAFASGSQGGHPKPDVVGYKKVNESMELKKLEDAILMFQKKIKKQGRVTNARDEDHLKNLIKVYKQMGGRKIKESVNEGGVEKVLKMANDQSFGKLGGRTVDALSAGLFKGVYNKASDKHKEKINKMNEKQLYVFMTKLWSKFGNQVRIG